MHIFHRMFLSNYWWQESYIWSQASYRYAILWEAFLDPSDSYFLFADFVGFYTHWTYMLIFRRIFLSNYWGQKSDIWSQASYRWPISWEAKCDEKWAYMFNVYKNQLSRQTGSRNLMGSKMLPTIWGTYMTLVTKYQISVINSCWEKCDEKCAYMFNVYKDQLSRQLVFIHIKHICSFFVAFFSATIEGRNLIFGHKLHIGTPYRGKRF
jgi:hypothetical protein